MSKKPETEIQKTESHITELPREIDQRLAIALGEMVVAFGRLEDMFKVTIKRLEGVRTLPQVIKDFMGMEGTIGNLVIYCKTKFPRLVDCWDMAAQLNVQRQDFIHATFAADDTGQYIRFRKLLAYKDLEQDITRIKKLTDDVNSLIEIMDRETGSPLTDPSKKEKYIARVSAGSYQFAVVTKQRGGSSEGG